MSHEVSRSKVIIAWFAFLALVSVPLMVSGISIGMTTAALLVGLSIAPPALLLMLWPGVQPPTAGEVIRGERR